MLATRQPEEIDASRARGTLVHRHAADTVYGGASQITPRWITFEAPSAALNVVDTEAGMLSGISRKRSIRSNPCWFTEFCKSQCLSHFAAPFIVVRAETSVAESCKEALTKWRLPPRGEFEHKRAKIRRQADDRNRPRPPEGSVKDALPPPRPRSRHETTQRGLTLESSGDTNGFNVCE